MSLISTIERNRYATALPKVQARNGGVSDIHFSTCNIQLPRILGNPNETNKLFRIPGLGTVMYVFMGMTLDATLEAIRELRKVKEFQRFEGKRAVSNLYKLVCECDDRMCRLVGDSELGWLERTKDIFAEEVEADLMKYRITVNNIVNKCGYHGATSYAYAVIARSLARITSEWEEATIFEKFGAIAFDGKDFRTAENAAKGYYRLFGTLQIDKAMQPLDRIYDRDKDLQRNVKDTGDMQTISNGARIICDKVLDWERIVTIGNEQKAIAHNEHN